MSINDDLDENQISTSDLKYVFSQKKYLMILMTTCVVGQFLKFMLVIYIYFTEDFYQREDFRLLLFIPREYFTDLDFHIDENMNLV